MMMFLLFRLGDDQVGDGGGDQALAVFIRRRVRRPRRALVR